MKFKLVTLPLLLALLSITGCTSRSFKKDYEVVDASHQKTPQWIGDSLKWSKKEDKDSDKYRYFSFLSEPNTSRVIACEAVKARTGANIASEVVQKIQQNFVQSTSQHSSYEGSTSSYIQDQLVKDVNAKLTGVEVHRTYWEKRRYLIKLGAKSDRDAYVCASLARISTERLESLLEHAQGQLETTTDEASVEEKIQEAIEKTRSQLLGV